MQRAIHTAPALPAKYWPAEIRPVDARPPAWFRFAVVAIATLILCSCRAAIEQTQQTDVPRPQLLAHAGDSENLAGSRWRATPPVIPVVYNRPLAADSQSPCRNPQPAGYDSQSQVASRDEYLCDGGDDGLPVGVRQDWTVDGLEQEDTIAHYDTVDGRTVVTASNRVCIYSPRFGVVRRVTDLHQYARYDMAEGMGQNLSLAKIDENEKATTSLAQLEPSIHRARQSSSLLRERQQAGGLDRERRVAESIGSLAPYANLQIVRIGTVSNNEKVLVARSSLAAVSWAGDQGPQVLFDSKQAQAAVSEKHLGMVYHLIEPNQSKLRLVKLASSGSARVGEEIEFTLRYDNVGNRVIGNVTIADNLTTRLEYVEGSAKSSLPADFSITPNSGGSLVLRWEIREPVEPSQGGILQFKCRVR